MQLVDHRRHFVPVLSRVKLGSAAPFRCKQVTVSGPDCCCKEDLSNVLVTVSSSPELHPPPVQVEASKQRNIVEVLANVELHRVVRRVGGKGRQQVCRKSAQKFAGRLRGVRGCGGEKERNGGSRKKKQGRGISVLPDQIDPSSLSTSARHTEEPPRQRIRFLNRIRVRLVLRRQPLQAPDQLEVPRVESAERVQARSRQDVRRRQRCERGREDELDRAASDEGKREAVVARFAERSLARVDIRVRSEGW